MTDPAIMFLTFGVALFILCMKPGPDMMAVISRALHSGYTSAAALIFGTIAAELIYLWLVSYGFFVFSNYIDVLQFVFQSIGAALFIYLGVKGLRNLESGGLPGNTENGTLEIYAEDVRDYVHIEKPRTEFWPNFMTGLTVCLGNPIIILFYLTAYPAMIDLSEFKLLTAYICSFLVILCNGGPLFLIAFIADKMRTMLKNDQTVRFVNAATSLLFILIGFSIGFNAIIL